MSSAAKLFDAENSKPSLSYWKILSLGIVPVVGFGVWYYYRNKHTLIKKDDGNTATQDNGLVNKKVPLEQSTQPLKQNEKQIKANQPPLNPLEVAVSLKESGNTFFKEGNFSDAIRCYTEALDMCPLTEVIILSTIYQNRAAGYEKLNQLEDVVKDCSASLKLQPNYIKALMRRAKALRSLGRLKEAIVDVSAVCIMENFQELHSLVLADEILKELGKVHAAEAMKNNKPVYTSPHFVKSYFLSFPNDPVINFADIEVAGKTKILSEDGESSISHLEKAKQALYRGEYDDVILACSEAVRHGEGLEPEALLLRATMYLLRLEHSLALEDLNTIINSEVQNIKITVTALIRRGSIYIKLLDKESSLKDYETAISLDPDNAVIYFHYGQVHVMLDDMKQSMEYFKKSVSLDPKFTVGIMQNLYTEYRLLSKENSGGGAKTIEKFKRVIRKYPKCIDGYILFSQILMDQEQFEEADELFKEALKIDPTNAILWAHRGIIIMQWKGDIDTAVKYINKGIAIDDKCCLCYETLGTIEVQRGRLEEGIKTFEKVIELCKTETELCHVFSLRDAAIAQLAATERLGISINGIS